MYHIYIYIYIYSPLKSVVTMCTITFNIKNSAFCSYFYVFCTDVSSVISQYNVN